MKGSMQRVTRVLNHEKPDRIPLFDLLANDAVLTHFNNGRPVDIGDDTAAIRALTRATDGTRFTYFAPMAEREEQLASGQSRIFQRWTIWTSNRYFDSTESYAVNKAAEIRTREETLLSPVEYDCGEFYHLQRKVLTVLGDDYFFPVYGPSPGLMDIIEEVGLEFFSYCLADCEEVIIRLLEVQTAHACRWAEALPSDDPFSSVFIGEDIAYSKGPMVSPNWMRQHYFPKLAMVIDAMHARRKRVIFHSDGDINPIMDDLVACGIDVLNPIDTSANMCLDILHAKYPRLIFAGGIDINLLSTGDQRAIRDAVHKAIDDTQGQILVGSSSEVMNCVPLNAYLALRDAVINYN